MYGNPLYLPIDENHPRNPISPYGCHKLESENICAEFSRFWNIQTCSLRIFSAYGPGLYKQLFWDLARKADGNDRVQLYGTGLESRDFIYIDDIVRAFATVIGNDAFDGSTYNIASGRETTIKEAVQLFFSLYKPGIEFSFMGQNREGDPLNWRADTSKMRACGFEAEYELECGLEKYVEWLRGKR